MDYVISNGRKGRREKWLKTIKVKGKIKSTWTKYYEGADLFATLGILFDVVDQLPKVKTYKIERYEE
jgi:hypothetical protein